MLRAPYTMNYPIIIDTEIKISGIELGLPGIDNYRLRPFLALAY